MTKAAAAAGTRIGAAIADLRPQPIAPSEVDTPEPSVTKPAAKPAVASRSNVPTSADDDLARFAVQLGSFAGADNADRLQNRVRSAGYPAFVERIDAAKGPRYLVKVGPLLSRNDASATRDRLERETGIKGILVDYL